MVHGEPYFTIKSGYGKMGEQGGIGGEKKTSFSVSLFFLSVIIFLSLFSIVTFLRHTDSTTCNEFQIELTSPTRF